MPAPEHHVFRLAWVDHRDDATRALQYCRALIPLARKRTARAGRRAGLPLWLMLFLSIGILIDNKPRRDD